MLQHLLLWVIKLLLPRFYWPPHTVIVNELHRSTITLRCHFLDFVAQYHQKFDAHNVLWVSDISTSLVDAIPYKQSFNKLGQEADTVVFDATQVLAVNAFGAVTGCIRGGGSLILLLPLGDQQYQGSFFYKRLARVLSEHDIPTHTLDSVPSIRLPINSGPRTSNASSEHPTATIDQNLAIQAVKKVVTGHRNRPVVITSDRGRGKSSALGMAIRKLLEERPIKIIVCAPAKAMVTPLYNFAGEHSNLHYLAPDELAQALPEAGLVVIDEAGAIPIPLLSKLLQHYCRLVFATTLHGYEGNGRGFAIRFHDQLNQFTPDWRSVELTQPIRWEKNDPLEALVNDLLLLNSETIALDKSADALETPLYRQISQLEIFNDEALLRQLFGLLVLAHYQTRPSDLLQILDNPQLSIHGMFMGERLVAIALVSHEGGLDSTLAMAIYRGERRTQGHLVPQVLLSQMGILEASTLTTDRIMRIASHPLYRRRQLASRLLEAIHADSKADYLSTSFGLSHDLHEFWSKANYRPVYLGLKREASSGTHSAVLLRKLSKSGNQLVQAATRSFTSTFVAQLGDPLKKYDPSLAYELLLGLQQKTVDLNQQEIRDIKRFISGQCGLDSALAAVQRWLPGALIDDKQKNSKETELLIMRILQHQDWASCCEALGIPGKQIALRSIQKTVSVLADHSPIMDHPRKD